MENVRRVGLTGQPKKICGVADKGGEATPQFLNRQRLSDRDRYG
jgi:hypothetical protein